MKIGKYRIKYAKSPKTKLHLIFLQFWGRDKIFWTYNYQSPKFIILLLLVLANIKKLWN